MPITRETPQREINRQLLIMTQRMTKALVRKLFVVGEKCRNRQILSHRYTNRSGNLESSTGYVVTVDGEVVDAGGFEIALEGKEGAGKGRKFAHSLASQYPRGVCLIFVAGENYAAYVSDMGLDVLDSAEQLARRIVPEMIRKLEG